jgi:hypothetical protein
MDNSITLLSSPDFAEFKRNYVKRKLMFWDRKKSRTSRVKNWAKINPAEAIVLGAASLAALKYGGKGLRSGIRRTGKQLKNINASVSTVKPSRISVAKRYVDNTLTATGRYARKDINAVRQRWARLSTGNPLPIKYPLYKGG